MGSARCRFADDGFPSDTLLFGGFVVPDESSSYSAHASSAFDSDSIDPLLDIPEVTFRDRVLDAVAVARADVASIVGAVVLLLFVAGGVWWSRSGDDRPELVLPMATPEMVSVAPTAPTSLPSSDVVVHAAGAVASPGLYELPAGSRVDDVIAAAGGSVAGADLDRVNLASPVRDGTRVFIPLEGEAAPGVVAGDGAGQAEEGPIDINTADAQQLEALPGVGPATASAILEHRSRTGAFRAIEDLLEVRGIGEAKLEQLRSHVTV